MAARSAHGSDRRPMVIVATANAVAAWAGGLGLILGALDFGDELDDRLPFGSLLLAGVALVAIVAIPSTLLAWAAWTGSDRTPDIALVAGALLVGWIVMQVVVLRSFSVLQPVYLAVGVSLMAMSGRVRLGRRRRGSLLVVVGSIILAVGIGLLPHLVDHAATAAGILALVLVLAGLGAVLIGAVHATRGVSRPRAGAALVGVVAVVLVAAWIVAPAVAATHVRSTELTVTPDDLSLVHETVRVTTADGVDLAGWYLPSANGAAVVMLHGAGSTRSNVLHHAAALAESGFGVVALDARGHGESDGVAMDFGWYGDLDIAAGVDYLEQRPEVDPARIGLVGFSLGGEAAIGAASGDARIQAVVAEGATGRQADDKDWYSDVYGWRGWVQEQIEKVQFGLVDLLTIAGPPTALRDSIAQAAPTQFLLITAATVPDEGHAAEDLRAAAPDRVEVWTIDGVGHTGGYERDPVGWQRRVTSFLDDAL